MKRSLLESIEKSCELAELVNDPTCNITLTPKELRYLLKLLDKRTKACETALTYLDFAAGFDGEDLTFKPIETSKILRDALSNEV